MEKIDILVSLLSHLGSIDISTLDKRIIFRKSVYFLKVFGIEPGYEFKYYIRGPFSFDLMNDSTLFLHAKTAKIEFKDKELEKRFKDYIDFITPYKDNARQLELLASMQFLKVANREKTREEICKTVMSKFDNKSSIPNFTETECVSAWEYLSKWHEYTSVPDWGFKVASTSVEQLPEDKQKILKSFFKGSGIPSITDFSIEPKQKKTPETLDSNNLKLIERQDEIEHRRNKNKLELKFDEKERGWKLKKRQILFYLLCGLVILIFILSIIGVAYFPEGSDIHKNALELIKAILFAALGGLAGYSYAKHEI